MRADAGAGMAGAAVEAGEGGVCFECGGEGGASAGVAARGGSGGGPLGAGEAGVVGATAVGGTGGGPSSESAGEAGEGGAGDGVALSKVAVYQAVEVPLMAGGRVPTRNAAVVAGRRALVRAWLAPGPASEPRELLGTLTLKSTLGDTSLEAELTLASASTNDVFGSTLNFELPPTVVSEDTTLSLRVIDVQSGSELARWPASGSEPLAAEDSHGPFVMTLVPLVVAGNAPDLTAGTVKRYERLMRAMYPVPDLEVSVHDPVTLSFDVLDDGSGWDEALDELYAVRAGDDPVANAYYYGVLTPRPTNDEYCPQNCTVGLSVVAGANEELYRGAIGTGYFERPSDTFSPETLAHELGHALGRDHSPCGTPDGDPLYPYPDGNIGSWGYDGIRLRDPSVDTDVMGYCVPVWISDYTYDRLFTRIAFVNGRAAGESATPAPVAPKSRFRTVVVRPDGTLGWGRDKLARGGGTGPTRSVDLLDANGHALATLAAPFARFDHLPGGFLTLPAAALDAPDVASVRVGRGTLRRH